MAYTTCMRCNTITNLAPGDPTNNWICPNCRILKRIEQLEATVAVLELKIVAQEKSA